MTGEWTRGGWLALSAILALACKRPSMDNWHARLRVGSTSELVVESPRAERPAAVDDAPPARLWVRVDHPVKAGEVVSFDEAGEAVPLLGPPPKPARSRAELPRQLEYRPGAATPHGYRYVKRPRYEFTLTGGLTFAASYLPLVGYAAYRGFAEPHAWLAVPVLGPLQWQVRETRADTEGSYADFLILWVALVQGGGLGLFTTGLILGPKEKLVREDLLRDEARRERPSFSLALLPTRAGGSLLGTVRW